MMSISHSHRFNFAIKRSNNRTAHLWNKRWPPFKTKQGKLAYEASSINSIKRFLTFPLPIDADAAVISCWFSILCCTIDIVKHPIAYSSVSRFLIYSFSPSYLCFFIARMSFAIVTVFVMCMWIDLIQIIHNGWSLTCNHLRQARLFPVTQSNPI